MKLSQETKIVLWVLFSLSTALLLTYSLLFTYQDANQITGAASAQVNLCISAPTSTFWLNPITCDPAVTGTLSTCNVSADNATGIQSYSIGVLSGNDNGTQLFENVSNQGILSINATRNQTGEYELELTAQTNTTCGPIGTTRFNYTILSSDEPPIFTGPIPNSTWQQGEILVPYNLNSFFTDPQGYLLSFRVQDNSQVKVDIIATGEVTLTPANNFCGEEIISYVATNTANLSTQSNSVTLTIECKEQPERANSGGGGGGGGGAACREVYHCYEWSSCQYTSAVTPTGNKQQLNITGVGGEKTYLLDESVEDEKVFYQGYQYRECIDTRACTERRPVYVRSCEYQPSCSDGIQNQDETDIDCGGVCGPCNTCSDGIQNGQETGVDCGGVCGPCNTCSDGIINGQETGVDCGGPECPTCATCFDGIQNQGETGVDCGGPCQTCIQEQEPAPIATALTITLIILLGIISTIVLAAVLARNYVIKALAAYMQRYKRKNRILLLTAAQRKQLQEKISSLKNATMDSLHRQQRYADIVREYAIRAFSVSREYSQEEIVVAVNNANLHEKLKEFLHSYFSQAQQIEFSRAVIDNTVFSALLIELEQLIAQTGVPGVEDLQAASHVPDFSEPEQRTQQAFFTVLEYLHEVLIQSRVVLAQRAYQRLHHVYSGLDEQTQEQVYVLIQRAYLALEVEEEKQHSLLYGRMIQK